MTSTLIYAMTVVGIVSLFLILSIVALVKGFRASCMPLDDIKKYEKRLDKAEKKYKDEHY